MNEGPFAQWFGKPVAIQLKTPAIVYETARNEKGYVRIRAADNKLYGQPDISKTMMERGPALFLCGNLRSGGDGWLVLTMQVVDSRNSISRSEVMLRQDDVQYLSVITGPPENDQQGGRIIAPS